MKGKNILLLGGIILLAGLIMFFGGPYIQAQAIKNAFLYGSSNYKSVMDFGRMIESIGPIAIILGFVLMVVGVVNMDKESEQIKKLREVDNSRRCISCGRKIVFDALLCPYCGKKFDNIGESVIIDLKDENKITKKRIDNSDINNNEIKQKFCPKCGKELTGSPKFCYKCGHDLR